MTRTKLIKRIGRLGWMLAALLMASACISGEVSAQTLNTVVSFSGTNGTAPYAGLIFDADGNLLGTTISGGPTNQGTVFEIKADRSTATGYASTPTTLATFNGSNGANPYARLTIDVHGNLFGTTEFGGAYNRGTVFEIPVDNTTATGYASTPTTLVSFNQTDGANPIDGSIFDAQGNLFGTTRAGGPVNDGTVFELKVDNTTATGYASTPMTLVTFNGSDGADPHASLAFDAHGNLFGTTFGGGAFGQGTVFEIKVDSSAATGYASTPTTLVSFNGSNGALPTSSVIFDAEGNLLGASYAGGHSPCWYDCGTVYELKVDNTTATGYASTPTTLVSFNGSNGALPVASLIFDAHGNLFGTTFEGGASNVGTLFEVKVDNTTATGYESAPTTLVTFNGGNGRYPVASLIYDTHGNLFGTTESGGTTDNGTVFEVTGSGFVPPNLYAGTPRAPNCVGVSISSLAQEYGGVAHAAESLGFESVNALQNSVATYCGR
jgi:uncharacterized repeat protein (TIGR03803 family)